MKLILIIPPSPWLISDRDHITTGILYISSYLKVYDYEVQVCDLAGIPEKYWHIPIGDIYGITGVSPNFPYMKKIIDILKNREPHKTIVVGGPHATVFPEHILSNTKADICVIGEGEKTMFEIMWGVDLKKLKGIMTRDFITPPRPLIKNLDIIPFPDRDSVDYYNYMRPQTYKYLSNGGNELESSIITSRGCPYKCSFCASHSIHKGIVRYRSAENVINELKMMKEKYGIKMCNFVDDTFTMNKKRLIKICEGIKDLDIKWFFLTRVDKVDLDTFKMMKDAGAVSVTYGFESGSNKVLEVLKKYTTVEQAYNAIKISDESGLKVRGQLMVGMPSETKEDVEMTAKFIKNSPTVETFGLHVFQPYPGCDVWNNPDKYNWNINKDTDFNDFHTIGKPDTKLTSDKKIQDWYDYLKNIISDRSIEYKGALETI